jgi:hypothetical protein
MDRSFNLTQQIFGDPNDEVEVQAVLARMPEFGRRGTEDALRGTPRITW